MHSEKTPKNEQLCLENPMTKCSCVECLMSINNISFIITFDKMQQYLKNTQITINSLYYDAHTKYTKLINTKNKQIDKEKTKQIELYLFECKKIFDDEKKRKEYLSKLNNVIKLCNKNNIPELYCRIFIENVNDEILDANFIAGIKNMLNANEFESNKDKNNKEENRNEDGKTIWTRIKDAVSKAKETILSNRLSEFFNFDFKLDYFQYQNIMSRLGIGFDLTSFGFDFDKISDNVNGIIDQLRNWTDFDGNWYSSYLYGNSASKKQDNDDQLQEQEIKQQQTRESDGDVQDEFNIFKQRRPN